MANNERQQHLLRLTQLRLTLNCDHKDAAERRQHQEIDDCISRAVERLEVYNTVERVHVVGFEASTSTAMSLVYSLGTLLVIVMLYLTFPEGAALF